MKISYSLLKTLVNTSLTAEALGDLLTMAGFELEEIEMVNGAPVLDIKVMSNRGDGLSAFGLAREILAKDPSSSPTDLYRRAVAHFADVSLPAGPAFEVRIETPSCSRFSAMRIENVTNGPSPVWLQDALTQVGQRPISVLVDLTNYVMLELGQPLHAFDADRLGDTIVVREARDGEKLTTLNGTEHTLAAGQLMICDDAKPVGVAGTMGGLDTEVHEGTERIVLESAHFLNRTVRKTRKQLGLSTEASYRFERSVDPNGVVSAQRRFADLLQEIQPSAQVFEPTDLYPSPPSDLSVSLRLGRASRLLGMSISVEQAARYFTALGFSIQVEGNQLAVTLPSWRPDIVREEDLIEELGRIHGYEQIPESLPSGTSVLGGVWGRYAATDRLIEAAIAVGYSQVINHSLQGTSPLDAAAERIGPRNPSSPDLAYLRNGLLAGMAVTARLNGGKDLHLAEVGRIFTPGRESVHLCLLSNGDLNIPDRASETSPKADFFSLKADIFDIFLAVGIELSIVEGPTDPRFHPGRQASITRGDVEIGVIGEIHPTVANELGLAPRTVAAEVDLDAIFALGDAELPLRAFGRYPSVRRDIALLVSKAVPFAEIESRLRRSIGSVLERLWLFDVFIGAGIPAGSHSLGIALVMRKPDGSFTDEEANQLRDAAVAELAELGATTR